MTFTSRLFSACIVLSLISFGRHGLIVRCVLSSPPLQPASQGQNDEDTSRTSNPVEQRCSNATDGSPVGANSFLWVVNGRHRPSFFFGTIHVPYTRVWPSIPSNAKLAFVHSDTLHLELDLLDPATISGLQRCQLLPHGKSISDVIPRALYRRLKQHLHYVRSSMPSWLTDDQRGQGIYADHLFDALTGNWERKRPIYVMMMLNSLNEGDVRLRGTPVLDLYLAQEAQRMKKRRGAVEKVEEHCTPLNDMNLSQVLFALNRTLWQQETRRRFGSSSSSFGEPSSSPSLLSSPSSSSSSSSSFSPSSSSSLSSSSSSSLSSSSSPSSSSSSSSSSSPSSSSSSPSSSSSSSSSLYSSDDLVHHYNCGDLNEVLFSRDSAEVPDIINDPKPSTPPSSTTNTPSPSSSETASPSSSSPSSPVTPFFFSFSSTFPLLFRSSHSRSSASSHSSSTSSSSYVSSASSASLSSSASVSSSSSPSSSSTSSSSSSTSSSTFSSASSSSSSSSVSDTAREIDDYFRDALIYRRNERMADRVDRLLRHNERTSFFFAFGAGHFLGDRSVIDLLRRKGYNISHSSPDELIDFSMNVVEDTSAFIGSHDAAIVPVLAGDETPSSDRETRQKPRIRHDRRKAGHRNWLQGVSDSAPAHERHHHWLLPVTDPAPVTDSLHLKRSQFNDLWIRLDSAKFDMGGFLRHQVAPSSQRSGSFTMTTSPTSSRATSLSSSMATVAMVAIVVRLSMT